MNVVLIGMKHCGKSTLGRALASRWGCPFHDVDPMIEALYTCETGRRLSVRDIWRVEGEERFHEIEGLVVCDLYMQHQQQDAPSVVSLGGRTAVHPSVHELLGAIGTVVCLELDVEELWRRILRTGVPPFLEGGDPHAAFERLYAEREPRYRALADVVVNLDGLDVEAAVDKLARSIEEHTHAR